MLYDAFVIGQGLAGSVVSTEMLNRGKKVLVFDDSTQSKSSLVAAGICNPITGKRQTLTWNAADFFPSMEGYYKRLELDLDIKLFNPLSVLRILSSVGQENHWASQATEPRYKEFIGTPIFKSLDDDKYITPHDCLNVVGGGWVNLPRLIEAVRSELIKANSFVDECFNWNNCETNEPGYTYAGYQAKSIIFSEGVNASSLWNFLPFTPMKGEVLTIECDDANTDNIIIGSCFMVPIGGQKFRVGATYDWRNVDNKKTDEGRSQIEERLHKFLKLPYHVIGHEAGIRPAVKDRRPLIGEHPEHKNVYLFNGLGSKGASTAPLLAQWLLDFIFERKELPLEVNIKRYL